MHTPIAPAVLPVRRDGHSVTFRWETHPASGYPDNTGDTFTTIWPSGVGEPLPGGRGYRDTTPKTLTASKDVPTSPVDASCSAYGVHR